MIAGLGYWSAVFWSIGRRIPRARQRQMITAANQFLGGGWAALLRADMPESRVENWDQDSWQLTQLRSIRERSLHNIEGSRWRKRDRHTMDGMYLRMKDWVIQREVLQQCCCHCLVLICGYPKTYASWVRPAVAATVAYPHYVLERECNARTQAGPECGLFDRRIVST